jgi:hypothetical protein
VGAGGQGPWSGPGGTLVAVGGRPHRMSSNSHLKDFLRARGRANSTELASHGLPGAAGMIAYPGGEGA